MPETPMIVPMTPMIVPMTPIDAPCEARYSGI